MFPRFTSDKPLPVQKRHLYEYRKIKQANARASTLMEKQEDAFSKIGGFWDHCIAMGKVTVSKIFPAGLG